MTRSSLVVVALLLAACSKTPEPQKEEGSSNKGAPSTEASGTPAPQPTAVKTDDLTYTVPPSWQSAPNTSPMRKATFKIAKIGSDPEDAELSVSTAGGGVDQNIDRWAGQFGGATPAKEQRSPNGLKVTVVNLSGTYAAGGMMGAPTQKPKWALLGAVVDLGNTLYFFKLTGPEQTVNATKKDFDAFVASFQKK